MLFRSCSFHATSELIDRQSTVLLSVIEIHYGHIDQSSDNIGSELGLIPDPAINASSPYIIISELPTRGKAVLASWEFDGEVCQGRGG